MPDGKNAVGLKGFPTPDTASGIDGYLMFLFNDPTFAQWLLGALEPLVYEYSWYKSGDLEPDEAAEIFREIVQDAPYNLRSCSNPDGGKIIRINGSGHAQQLNDASEWEDPTGDYEIPPVPTRTGGTPDDQICLAAANAANTLMLLYENITDSFNDDLDEAEALTALTLALTGLIGAAFAPITFAIVTFFGWVFGVLYATLEFVGADLWDGDFTAVLVCILVQCATNTAGVVTFDWDCFNEKLANQVEFEPDLTFQQLRLFGQLQYLLSVIGGVDALNVAGGTTDITSADCDDCIEHCFTIDLKAVDGSAFGVTMQGGTWVATSGWHGANLGAFDVSDLYGYWQFPATRQVSVLEIEYFKQNGAGADNQTRFFYLYPTATSYATVAIYTDSTNTVQSPIIVRTYEPNQDLAGLGWDINSGSGAGPIVMQKLTIRYFGAEMFGGDNC